MKKLSLPYKMNRELRRKGRIGIDKFRVRPMRTRWKIKLNLLPYLMQVGGGVLL